MSNIFDDWNAVPPMDMEEDDMIPLFPMDEDEETPYIDFGTPIPILPLKNTVLFPGVVIPITIGRQQSIEAITKAYKGNKMIGVLSQKDARIESPTADDLFHVGTVAKIIRLLKVPDGTTTAIIKGQQRFVLEEMVAETPFMEARIMPLPSHAPNDSKEFLAYVTSIKELAQRIVRLSPNIPPEAGVMLKNIERNTFLLNFISSNLSVKTKDKQVILETNDLIEKAKLIMGYMNNELQLLELRDQIESKVRGDLDKQQRDYFLNQQLKTIQEELGGNPQSEELNELEKRAKDKKWNDKVKATFEKELKKARRINPQMADYGITITYLENLLDLPWEEYTEDNFDLKKAQKILDDDHFGLDKVKDRIIEHLAVLKLKGDMKAPIVCLVGPPGVGKTSLGKSVARALNRKYVRMSLGGLHDESEIRGHRKTYIGAMPGRLMQSLKKVGSSNPVFILDEIDKIGKDLRGDPSSALLEVLDPEQNTTFYDNYLELEYDLSKVLFIATANSLNTIQPALRDRMEIIQVSGYSIEEKVEIAKRHLVPKQRKEHGLNGKQIRLNKDVLEDLVQSYTRESGVRSLERQVAGVMRNVAKKVAMEEDYNVSVKKKELKDILGPSKFSREKYQEKQPPGVVVGLAWTSVGGAILFIETSLSKGKGSLTLTGNLGNVMKESATTALSYLKAHAAKFDLDDSVFEKTNVHIHVPEGAIPKDGPSAGITMLTALASAFSKKSVKPFLAMTGEITLRGRVLPVGGIKEKILAAKRAGIKEIVLCHENEKNVEEIEESY
ncbi:MAG: endopeptidase La, partial [Saprospiraceae bacterium]